MNEREFVDKFRARVIRAFPNIFFYKIPDTAYLGGKKPFDIIIIHCDKTICLEAKKSAKEKPTPYQRVMLDKAGLNGAIIGTICPEKEYKWMEELKRIQDGNTGEPERCCNPESVGADG